jgi:hypothetical protein
VDSAWARLVKSGLFQHLPKSEIFMDVDTIEPGMDFVAAIGGIYFFQGNLAMYTGLRVS